MFVWLVFVARGLRYRGLRVGDVCVFAWLPFVPRGLIYRGLGIDEVCVFSWLALEPRGLNSRRLGVGVAAVPPALRCWPPRYGTVQELMVTSVWDLDTKMGVEK